MGVKYTAPPAFGCQLKQHMLQELALTLATGTNYIEMSIESLKRKVNRPKTKRITRANAKLCVRWIEIGFEIIQPVPIHTLILHPQNQFGLVEWAKDNIVFSYDRDHVSRSEYT